jgi:outer membrane protein W
MLSRKNDQYKAASFASLRAQLFLVAGLAALLFYALPAAAEEGGEGAPQPAPAPVEAAPELQPTPPPSAPEAAPAEIVRRAESYLAPSYGLVFDHDTTASLGNPYGGYFSFRYFLLSHLSVEASVSYMIGYQKQNIDISYVSYTRLSSITVTPFHAAVNIEILPHSRFNPYLGIGGGGLYFILRQSPEDVDSGVPIMHDELALEEHRLLPMLVGKVGMDVRLTEYFGVGAEVLYRYCPFADYRIEIPEASRHDQVQLSHLAFTLGISVYY